jgi:hypothetical protein
MIQGALPLDSELGAGLKRVWPLRPCFGGDKQLGHPFAYWRSLVREGVTERRPNATIEFFTGHLLWHRVRCQPPLSDEDVIRSVKSIE